MAVSKVKGLSSRSADLRSNGFFNEFFIIKKTLNAREEAAKLARNYPDCAIKNIFARE
jgi:hypothetical protein